MGTLGDKVRVLPLLYHVFKAPVEELFGEEETSTLVALKERWGFSDQFVCQFFEPFLGGIYLAPLEEQSSRMFHFIFKMFAEGSACLPEGGMSAVGEQVRSGERRKTRYSSLTLPPSLRLASLVAFAAERRPRELHHWDGRPHRHERRGV